MALNLTAIIKEGVYQSSRRNGLILIGIFFVLYVISGFFETGIIQPVTNLQYALFDIQSTPVIAVSPVIAVVVSLGTNLVSYVIDIGAIRVFVSNETERLPREYFTRNIVWAILNFIVGGIFFIIIVALGLVALIIPGIFLLVVLVFWTVYVAVEDQNFIESFRNSWGLTRGHRIDLFILGILVLLLSAIIDLVFVIGTGTGVTIGFVLIQVGNAITTVFSTAVLAAAYNELTALPDEDGTLSVGEGSRGNYVNNVTH
jgi:hypothetical protein